MSGQVLVFMLIFLLVSKNVVLCEESWIDYGIELGVTWTANIAGIAVCGYGCGLAAASASRQALRFAKKKQFDALDEGKEIAKDLAFDYFWDWFPYAGKAIQKAWDD